MRKYKDFYLAKAIALAVDAHQDQYDKAGKPYILHPLHLMNQFLFDPELAMIAVMHDIIEDSDYTLEYLFDVGFSTRVVDALQLLTHKKEGSYEDYIRKICTNYDAIRVKRKDLQHNSDITRLKGVTEKDIKRMEKHHRAFIQLGEAKRRFE